MNFNSLTVKRMMLKRKFMRITAEDVCAKQFQETSPGLDEEEVLAFLEAIKDEMCERDKEYAVLMERVSSLAAKERVMTSALCSMLLLI